MKAAGAAAHRYAKEPGPPAPVVVVFGPDRGAVRALADAVALRWRRTLDEEPTVTRLADDEVREGSGRLEMELSSASLFGGRPLVRARLTGEAGAAGILEILARIDDGRFHPMGQLIVEAGDLGARSKLRSGVEAARQGAALQLFETTPQERASLVLEHLRAAGVALEAEALERFLADVGEDRDIALKEAEKLVLYAHGLARPINAADVDALSAVGRSGDGEDAAAAALGGDAPSAIMEARRALAAGSSAIALVRAVERRARRLREVVALSSRGRSFVDAISSLQPPAFRAEQHLLSRDAPHWVGGALDKVLEAARAAELGLKRAGAIEGQAVERLLGAVARLRRGV